MIKRLITLVLLCPALAFAASIDDELNSVTIVNNTGEEVVYLFASPGDAEVWGPDLLESETTLAAGEEYEFLIHYPDPSNEFDFRVVTASGAKYTRWQQVVTDGEPVRIEFTATHADGEVDYELVEVTIENKTGFELYYLFFSPEESAMWGPDILAADVTIAPDALHRFYVPVSATHTYNLLAEDVDGDQYMYDITLRPGVDVTREITLDDLQ